MTNNKFFTYNGKCSSVVIFSVLQYNCFFVAHNRDANSNLPSVYISVAHTPWRCIKQRLFLALHFIHVYFSALLHLITIP